MEKLIKIPKWVCNIYLNQLPKLSIGTTGAGIPTLLKEKDIGLQDGDKANRAYHSKRSNMVYCYLVSHLVLFLNTCIVWYVKWKTGIHLNAEINKRCAPIFTYGVGGECKVHRDRDMLNGKARFPEYVAVLCLQQDYSGGELFVNNSPYNQVSNDGKEIREATFGRRYYKLGKGDLLIFNNRNSVHGVTEVIAGQRITTGFRSL